MPSPASGVDSRQYRISFPIEAPSQVPADFVLPSDFEAFDAGVFLPRDDADWLGRRRYPARILLLSGREVLIMPHPAAGEQTIRVPLDRIERIEWVRILLIGGVVLTWDGGLIRLPYNTRARGPVEKCVRKLMDRWLPPQPVQEIVFAGAFGEPLDLKFEFARSAELLAAEAPLAQFFQPGGDLMLVTSRRLLWVTERRNGRYERYGTVSHSARLSSIAGVRCVWKGQRGALEIAFRSGDAWHVPLREDQTLEARRFEAAVLRML